MPNFIYGLLFILSIIAAFFFFIMIVANLTLKECPRCKGSGRVYKYSIIDYTCPTCKGAKFVFRKVKV